MFILLWRGVKLGGLVVFDGKFLHNLKKMVSCMPYNITPVDIRHPETDRDAMMPLNIDDVL